MRIVRLFKTPPPAQTYEQYRRGTSHGLITQRQQPTTTSTSSTRTSITAEAVSYTHLTLPTILLV
eukprot:7225490-Pyramimonas_sp.AAC.1